MNVVEQDWVKGREKDAAVIKTNEEQEPKS